MLHLEREPVGIYFANTTAVCDLDANPEKRNCVIPLLMKVSEGTIISMDEQSCNCAGAATAKRPKKDKEKDRRKISYGLMVGAR